MFLTILALAIATAIPLLALFLTWKFDRFSIDKKFRFILLCFFWGALFAFGLAYFINTMMLRNGMTLVTLKTLAAPFTEEILKALILIYLVRRADFAYFVDGAVFGFAIGIGFAVAENFDYVLANQQAALGIAISRVLSTNLMHATASAIIGIMLGFTRSKWGKHNLLGATQLLGGWLMALAVHMAFNYLVTVLNINGLLLLIFAVAIGLGGSALIMLLIRRGLKESKAWCKEVLTRSDNVAANDLRRIDAIESMKNDLLKPIRDTFGPQYVPLVEDLIKLQGQLGINLRMVHSLHDESLRKAHEKEANELRAQIEEIRNKLPYYVRAHVRFVYDDNIAPVWAGIQSSIEERIAARPKEGGANLWATLGQRTAEASEAGNGTPAPDKTD